MSDPVTMGLGGAALGAVMDKKDPMRGAMLGGLGGAIGGPMFSAAAETPAAVAAVTPGLTAGGEQAAMLAAQNAGFGMEGLAATGAAGGNSLLGGMGGLSSMMNNPASKLGMNMLMQDKGQGQGQPMPIMPAVPQQMRPQFQPGTFSSLAPQFAGIANMPFNKNVAPLARYRG